MSEKKEIPKEKKPIPKEYTEHRGDSVQMVSKSRELDDDILYIDSNACISKSRELDDDATITRVRDSAKWTNRSLQKNNKN